MEPFQAQMSSQDWVSRFAGRFQITVPGLIWGLWGIGRQTLVTSADRLFYLQLSCSELHQDQIVLPKLKMFFLILRSVKQGRGSARVELHSEEPGGFAHWANQTSDWILPYFYFASCTVCKSEPLLTGTERKSSPCVLFQRETSIIMKNSFLYGKWTLNW